MSINFRLPNITATTPDGQLRQMQGYLYQTVEQLNWAMQAIENGTVTPEKSAVTAAQAVAEQEQKAAASFSEIKALIIKSADIVNAYYETISHKLSGMYVAQSEFGTFEQTTSQTIQESCESINRIFEELQSIISDVEGVKNTQIETAATIRTGKLYETEDGIPIYGMEIGQRTEVDGEEVFNKYAQFTADRLSFFDKNGIEVAYISDRVLHITDAEISGKFSHGGFVDEVIYGTSGEPLGVVTKWIGGG